MLPKNKLREELLSKYLIVHGGAFHPHFAQKLPQFTEPNPRDVNKHFGLDSIKDPESYEVIFESNPSQAPEELAQHPRNIDESIGLPHHLMPKEFSEPKTNLFQSALQRRNWRALRKYRKHKK